MIYLDPLDFSLLQRILKKYPYKFYAFGSRIHGTQRKFSDLDVFITDDISDSELFSLKEEIEDSDISIKIDIKRLQDVGSDFYSLIKNDLTLISEEHINQK